MFPVHPTILRGWTAIPYGLCKNQSRLGSPLFAGWPLADAATLMANDGALTAEPQGDEEDKSAQGTQQEIQPRRCYLFCPAGNQNRLLEELDHKTAAPLIRPFRDYVLRELTARGDLCQLEVLSLREKLDAFVLSLKPEDANVVESLKSGAIAIPGAVPDQPDGFDGVENVTGYCHGGSEHHGL